MMTFDDKHETWRNVGLVLAHRRRRWANTKPTLRQRFVFAGIGNQSGMSQWTWFTTDHR